MNTLPERLKRALENGAADTSADCAAIHGRLIDCVERLERIAKTQTCVRRLNCSKCEADEALIALSEVLNKEGK